jgi:amidase
VAVEAAMDTVITIDLVKGRTTPWPRIESDSHIMSTGSARPLEDAFRIAHSDLVSWMGEEFGLEALDAYQLLTQVSESPVANVVDPNYTFLTKVNKAYLPRAEAYCGVHGKLRETAREYLRGR